MRLEDLMLPCLNKKYLGFECMGCGFQRSIALLLRGEFIDAFYMYPAIYPLLLFITYLGAGLFMNLKFSNIVIPVLAILTVLTIIISYLIKLTN